MDAERLAELREEYKTLKRHAYSEVTISTEDFDDLLAAAGREAKLREALEEMADLWLNVGGTELNPAYENAVAALESKGGD